VVDEERLEVESPQDSGDLLGALGIAVVDNRALHGEDSHSRCIAQIHSPALCLRTLCCLPGIILSARCERSIRLTLNAVRA
jgi:hypothetical protein